MRSTFHERRRRVERQSVSDLRAALKAAETKIDSLEQRVIAGINERNRLHGQLAKVRK